VNAPDPKPLPGVGAGLPHESAHLHVTGRATYVDDIAVPAGTLHAALGLSSVAHGRIRVLDLSAVRAAPGVRDVIVAADIPGINDCGPVKHDDPILCAGEILFHGQPLFAVAADSHDAARRAARLARVEVEPLPAILTAAAAAEAESWVLPPVEVSRGDTPAALAEAPHRLRGEIQLGGQEHFYLEGQIACAIPGEDHTLRLLTSTQHPTEMQHMVAHALGWRVHQVIAECRRMGGGFGGKESQSAQIACIAAVLAVRSGKAVKLRLDRDDDMALAARRASPPRSPALRRCWPCAAARPSSCAWTGMTTCASPASAMISTSSTRRGLMIAGRSSGCACCWPPAAASPPTCPGR